MKFKYYALVISSIVIICGAILVWKFTSSGHAEQSNKISYNQFMSVVENYHRNFEFNGYFKISSEKGLSSHITAFPPDLLLEKRLYDGVDGDISKPSQYQFYYLKNDKSVLFIISVIYLQTDYMGIIYNTVISPEDNPYVSSEYSNLKRPYIIDKLIGCGKYTINLKTILLEPKSENMKQLKIEDSEIYKKIEEFVEKSDSF